MPTHVYANNNEIASKAADGKSIAAFPDVCFTPPAPPVGPLPLPYPNTGEVKDTDKGTTKVFIKDKMAGMEGDSYISKSMGDEAATQSQGKGLITGALQGKCYFGVWSMDVKMEGKGVPRHLDMVTHNHGSQGPNGGVGSDVDTTASVMDTPPMHASELTPTIACSFQKTEGYCGEKVGINIRRMHSDFSSKCEVQIQNKTGSSKFEINENDENFYFLPHADISEKDDENYTLVVNSDNIKAESTNEFCMKKIHFFDNIKIPVLLENKEQFSFVKNGDEIISAYRGASTLSSSYNLSYIFFNNSPKVNVTCKIYVEYQFDDAPKRGNMKLNGEYSGIECTPFETGKLILYNDFIKKRLVSINKLFSESFYITNKNCERAENCTCKIPINFNFEFIGKVENSNVSLQLYDEVSMHSTAAMGYREYNNNFSVIQYIWAHEFGHLVGMFDEYPDGALNGDLLMDLEQIKEQKDIFKSYKKEKKQVLDNIAGLKANISEAKEKYFLEKILQNYGDPQKAKVAIGGGDEEAEGWSVNAPKYLMGSGAPTSWMFNNKVPLMKKAYCEHICNAFNSIIKQQDSNAPIFEVHLATKD